MRRVPEREAARAAGERFYFTGKPCKNGHTVKRYTGTGLCSTCAVRNTLKSAAKRPEHPSRIAARAAREVHYSTGSPCKHGHEDRKFTANGICVQCSITRAKRWLAARPGYEAASARRRRAADPTSHRASSKRWADSNPERVRAALKDWKAANIDHVRAMGVVYSNARRARVAANGGEFTAEDVTELRALQKNKCAWCRKKIKLEVDHIKPILLGGANDRANLQLLCRRCNASKGANDAMDWARKHGRLL